MHYTSRVRVLSSNIFKHTQSTIFSSSGKTIPSLRVCCEISSCLTQCLKCKIYTFSSNYNPILCQIDDSRHRWKNSSKNFMSTSNHCYPMLRLGDYDCVGFDLDNTLCEYNISSSVEMEYKVLANFLVESKGYDSYYLLKPLDKNSLDFLQKGLVIDFSRGNLLKIGDTGIILKASHGTRLMTEKEIIDMYGQSKTWEVTSEFCQNMLVAWNGPLSERMRALLDYFDMPASLAFARIVDSLDHKLGKPADIYNIWPDVLAGLYNMYNREHFQGGEGGFFQEIKSNPKKFIKKCDPVVLEWLKKIKEEKLTFLITGSNCDFVSLTAESSLGKDWKSLFDLVICYARKPVFFSGCRPFIDLDGFTETNPVDGNDLELGKMYSQGNWQELYQLFGRKLGKKEPKCIYFGDNLIQDIYTPAEYTKCDVVAVVEELGIESITLKSCNGLNDHCSRALLSSQFWGSYFVDEKEDFNTVWSSLIKKYSKVCVPNLSVLAQHSINYEFPTFCRESNDGYFPVSPGVADAKKINAV